MIGRERVARRRSLTGLGHRQGRLQQPARLRGFHLAERSPRGMPAVLGAARPAALEQPVHLGRHPAVPEHATRVVVHHHDQGVRLFPGVAVHADDLVAVAEHVGVHVALAGRHRAHVLDPLRADHAVLHERQRGRLRLHGLARRAQAGDAGQQGQRGRAALLGGVAHQPLADEFLHVAGRVARRLFSPPGAEQLAHHQLSVQRAAHRQQLTGSPEHLGEQRVRWSGTGEHRTGPLPSAWVARPAGGLSSSALRAHMDSFPDSRGAVPRPRRMVAMFPRVADITGIQERRCRTFGASGI